MLTGPNRTGARPGRRVLIVRGDNLGDVLLTGPAVRAVAASGAEIHFLASPQGSPAAAALPGVNRVHSARLPWIVADPPPATPSSTRALVRTLERIGAGEAVVFTSFHQSPLPMALLLRMAGVARISALSVDYPGSLLDVRHSVPDDIHEAERSLSLAEAAGFRLPAGDDGRLRIEAPPATDLDDVPAGRYVVVHPGASVTARAWEPDRYRSLVAELVTAGRQVVVTGSPAERRLCAGVAAGAPSGAGPGSVTDLAGRTPFGRLAAVLSGADAVICGNTGPAHLAAAVGTPVVSLYAPTVPAVRWHPWMTPHVLLGVQDIGCAGCRARECPVPGHPCLSVVTPLQVVEALDHLVAGVPREEVAAR
jgi:ADP-heptose:LPS heptosyltransferase